MFYITLRMKQLVLGYARWLQTRHERFWADKVVERHYRFVVMNEETSFDINRVTGAIYFQFNRICRLITRVEIHSLCANVSVFSKMDVASTGWRSGIL